MTGGVISTDGFTTESHAFLEPDPWWESIISPLIHQKEAQTISQGKHMCCRTQMTRYNWLVCVYVCIQGNERRKERATIITEWICYLQVLIHYLGDEKTAHYFPHGNQKKNPEQKYVQQCPSSRKKTAEQVATTDPAKVYKTEIAAMDCHPAHVRVMKPRDIKQVYCQSL